MPELVQDVMTGKPVQLGSDATLSQAAKAMRDQDIGNVVVIDHDRPTGLVTDRDIVVRAVADDRDPHDVLLAEVATGGPVTVAASETAAHAAGTMREHSVRRLPVCDDSGQLVGIVSLGDLAVQRDPDSALADISQDHPDR